MTPARYGWKTRRVIAWAIVNRLGEHACMARPQTKAIALQWLGEMNQYPIAKEGPFRLVRLEGKVRVRQPAARALLARMSGGTE